MKLLPFITLSLFASEQPPTPKLLRKSAGFYLPSPDDKIKSKSWQYLSPEEIVKIIQKYAENKNEHDTL